MSQIWCWPKYALKNHPTVGTRSSLSMAHYLLYSIHERKIMVMNHDIRCDLCITMNTDIRIAILTLSRGIIQSKADPLRREKLCPNLLSPKFADAQMSSNFLPKFFVLKYIEPKVLGHKFLNTKVFYKKEMIQFTAHLDPTRLT